MYCNEVFFLVKGDMKSRIGSVRNVSPYLCNAHKQRLVFFFGEREMILRGDGTISYSVKLHTINGNVSSSTSCFSPFNMKQGANRRKTIC